MIKITGSVRQDLPAIIFHNSLEDLKYNEDIYIYIYILDWPKKKLF